MGSKWCPFARVLRIAGPEKLESYNRLVTHDSEGKPIVQLIPVGSECIRDLCMMWTGTTCALKTKRSRSSKKS